MIFIKFEPMDLLRIACFSLNRCHVHVFTATSHSLGGVGISKGVDGTSNPVLNCGYRRLLLVLALASMADVEEMHSSHYCMTRSIQLE